MRRMACRVAAFAAVCIMAYTSSQLEYAVAWISVGIIVGIAISVHDEIRQQDYSR